MRKKSRFSLINLLCLCFDSAFIVDHIFKPLRHYWVLRSSTDFCLYLFRYPDSPIYVVRSESRLSVTSRRSCRVEWALLPSHHSRRVAISVTHQLNRWCVMHFLVRRLRRHSHCNPSRTGPNQTESECVNIAKFYGRSVHTSSAFWQQFCQCALPPLRS